LHPEKVKALLGHSLITQTMDAYSHLLNDIGETSWAASMRQLATPAKPEWCQKTPVAEQEPSSLPSFPLTYAELKRVTDGARTRDLRSHNPPTSVSGRCRTLQNRLR
jgi:hypothetical protein